MNILIIGNGFDIAHGLPTKYTDFLKYCRDYQGSGKISNDLSINQEFEKIIAENVWLNYFLKITGNLDDDRTWIDFENEIRKAVIQFYRENESRNANRGVSWGKPVKKLQPNSFFEKFVFYKNDHMSRNVTELYKELRLFTRAFEIYCQEKINKSSRVAAYELNQGIFLRESGNEKTETYIVSFNYTRTFERLYDNQQGQPAENDYHYVFLHGEADVGYENKTENADSSVIADITGLVLGTQSFNRNDADKDIPTEFNIFQKHNQHHRYSTLADYQNLLKKLRDFPQKISSSYEKVNIRIVGHSLDRSDHAKLKHLLMEYKNADIVVYYHKEEVFEKYINNITEILGEEDVATRVQFKHQHDKVFGILLETES